jgi:GntR family transcriptional regulator
MFDICQEAVMSTNWSVRLEPESQTLGDRTAARLRELIRDGTFGPGDQLPSEPELAKRLGVSRPTLRAAVTELIADLLVVRRRGVGTFVSASPPHLSHGLERLLGTGRSIELLGRTPGTTGLRVVHTTADEDLASHLQVDEGDRLVHISRTRTADSVAVLHCEEWVPEDLLPESTALDGFGEDDSLYGTLAEMGLAVRQAIARIVPLVPDTGLRRRLNTRAGVPVLLLEQQHFLATEFDRVVLFSRNYYNTERVDLHTVRRR